MSLTLTTVDKRTPVPDAPNWYYYKVFAFGTGDGAGGAISGQMTTTQIPNQIPKNARLILTHKSIVSSDTAANNFYTISVAISDWSGLNYDNVHAAFPLTTFVVHSEYHPAGSDGNGNTIDTQKGSCGMPPFDLGNPLTETPWFFFKGTTNTNGKVYFFVLRGALYIPN